MANFKVVCNTAKGLVESFVEADSFITSGNMDSVTFQRKVPGSNYAGNPVMVQIHVALRTKVCSIDIVEE